MSLSQNKDLSRIGEKLKGDEEKNKKGRRNTSGQTRQLNAQPVFNSMLSVLFFVTLKVVSLIFLVKLKLCKKSCQHSKNVKCPSICKLQLRL